MSGNLRDSCTCIPESSASVCITPIWAISGLWHSPAQAQSCSDRCYTQWSTALRTRNRTVAYLPQSKILILFLIQGNIFGRYFADMAPNADIQISAISALKIFADNRYADIEKKCRYADIADDDINIGTSLVSLPINYWYFPQPEFKINVNVG